MNVPSKTTFPYFSLLFLGTLVPSFLPALASQTVHDRLVFDYSTPDRGVLRLLSTEFLPSGDSVCLCILSPILSPKGKDPFKIQTDSSIESVHLSHLAQLNIIIQLHRIVRHQVIRPLRKGQEL